MTTKYKQKVKPDDIDMFLRHHANHPLRISYDDIEGVWIVSWESEDNYYTSQMEYLLSMYVTSEDEDDRCALMTGISAIKTLMDMGIIEQ